MSELTEEPTRFNQVGTSGSRGTAQNIIDSYNETFEFNIAAQTGLTTFDTGLVLPSQLQAISAMLIVDTAEVTGVTKTLTVGFTGETAALMSATDASATGTLGVANGVAFPNPSGLKLLVTFGSDDWVEFVGRIVIEIKGVK